MVASLIFVGLWIFLSTESGEISLASRGLHQHSEIKESTPRTTTGPHWKWSVQIYWQNPQLDAHHDYHPAHPLKTWGYTLWISINMGVKSARTLFPWHFLQWNTEVKQEVSLCQRAGGAGQDLSLLGLGQARMSAAYMVPDCGHVYFPWEMWWWL